jgi:hypothetical protein
MATITKTEACVACAVIATLAVMAYEHRERDMHESVVAANRLAAPVQSNLVPPRMLPGPEIVERRNARWVAEQIVRIERRRIQRANHTRGGRRSTW